MSELTELELKYTYYIRDILLNATDYLIWSPNVTKTKKIELYEYRNKLRYIDKYDYTIEEPPEFVKLNSYYRNSIEDFKTKYAIEYTIDILGGL